ncbi:MAG: (5-formylfuran-3-yl)methyl phosphate synthase, partial [Chloroflexota bacterium]|nr:(5-formylfuran-3-yl)methyl phosphate synthase [Chloroflexota bacterium]
MILMVSVQDLYEAKQALKGGADIVDVKNLQEALVGSAHPNVVKQIRDEVPSAHHASVTLGVVPDQIGTVSMAVYAAGTLDATSVKVGFMVSEYSVALETLLAAKEALVGTQTKLIGSLFADNLLYEGGIDPDLMVKLAKEGQCDGFLIDTLVKDGRNLFDFVPEERLKEMVLEGKELGMSTALSGHLKMSDLDELSRVNPDIVGVRGAVCQKGDRDSRVHWESVADFKKQLDLRQTGEINVYAENGSTENKASDWINIYGKGKTCEGIISAISKKINEE